MSNAANQSRRQFAIAAAARRGLSEHGGVSSSHAPVAGHAPDHWNVGCTVLD